MCEARCHRESGTPDFLYPRTVFTSEYGIPVHDSLVNCVWWYGIPVVDFVSPYVSPTWILYPLPTDSDDYATTIESERLCERSRISVEGS